MVDCVLSLHGMKGVEVRTRTCPRCASKRLTTDLFRVWNIPVQTEDEAGSVHVREGSLLELLQASVTDVDAVQRSQFTCSFCLVSYAATSFGVVVYLCVCVAHVAA